MDPMNMDLIFLDTMDLDPSKKSAMNLDLTKSGLNPIHCHPNPISPFNQFLVKSIDKLKTKGHILLKVILNF